MIEDARNRGGQRRGQATLASECVRAVAPARDMQVPARALLSWRGLGEEARLQAHRRGDLLDGELGVGGVISRMQRRPGGQVELEQARRGFGVDSDQLDTKPVERRPQGGDESVEAAKL